MDEASFQSSEPNRPEQANGDGDGAVADRDPAAIAAAARRFFDRSAPPGYLDEWSAWLARPAERPDRTVEGDDDAAHGLLKGTGALIFRLNREWLAFPTRAVVETTLIRPVHRVPGRSGDVLRGLVNLRGQLQLCFSLYGLLGVDDSSARVEFPIEATRRGGGGGAVAGASLATTADRLIVLRDRERSEIWAFTADQVHGVERIPRQDLRGVPSTLSNPAVSFSQAIIAWNGRSVGLLDDQRVFAALRSLGR